MAPKAEPTDAILPLQGNYMDEIVQRMKTYEFRRYRIRASVQRVWFYLNAPASAIAYVCEIDPARTRNKGDAPLPEDGRGNREFNTRHKDWDRYDFAYRIRSVRKLDPPLTIAIMKQKYEFKMAPRGMVFLPEQIALDVPWRDQELLWTTMDETAAALPLEHPPDSSLLPENRKRAHDDSSDHDRHETLDKKPRIE
ncbi:hypothetical protein AURDEDRAFT_49906 [Auricularia subglabra TFB-10046 SS5]|nr:hypothetical protein AURDEDRAFT_49906 [Auricularia subglabra TFB-10046 SS5]